jgi:hypothetical protein
MFRNLTLFILLAFGPSLMAQFVNNGATVTIQPGATLRVESSFINNTGTVTNNGTLEVQDSFKNSATFFSGTSSTVRFIGTGVSQVKSNGAVLRNVEMSKTANNINLLDAATISGTINFVNDNNKVILGGHNFRVNSGGAVTSTDANEYFVATGTGNLIKEITSNGSVTMEVGDASFYSPITNAITASAYSSATVSSRVTNAVHPDKPASATPYLTRYWDVAVAGTTGLTNVMTGTYNEADDLVGSPEAELDGGSLVTGGIWNFTAGAVNTTNNTVTSSSTNGTVGFTGMKPFVTFDLTAFIEGFTNLSGTMTPVLMNSGMGMSATNVDDVTIELHNATTPYATAFTATGTLTTNGLARVALPGGAAGGNYYVVVKHRNALETWSAAPMIINNGGTYNFSSSAAQAFNSNMVLKGGKWCFYSGDMSAVQDGNIDLIDYSLWETDYNNFETGYRLTDLSGDGNVDLIDYSIWEANYNNFVSVSKP